jgi:hypothetical protein
MGPRLREDDVLGPWQKQAAQIAFRYTHHL